MTTSNGRCNSQDLLSANVNPAFENETSFRNENNSSRIFVIPLPDTYPETPPPSYESVVGNNIRTSATASAPPYNLTNINDPPPLYRLVVPNPPRKYTNRHRRSRSLTNVTVPVAEIGNNNYNESNSESRQTRSFRNNNASAESSESPPAHLMAAVNRRAKRSRQFDICRERSLNILHFLAVAVIPLYTIIAALIQAVKCLYIFGGVFIAPLVLSGTQIFGCGSLFYAKFYPHTKFSERASRYAGLILRFFFVTFLITTYFVMSLPNEERIKTTTKECVTCNNTETKLIVTTTARITTLVQSNVVNDDDSFCYETVRYLMRLGIWFTWGLLPLYIFVYIYLPSLRSCWVDR